MSLTILLGYLASSLLGIGLLALALTRFGHVGGALDEGEARRLAAEEGGHGEPLRLAHAWLFEVEGGILIVRAMGKRAVATAIAAGDVRAAEAREDGLRLRLARFDAPTVVLRTDEPARVRAWLAERGVLPR